MTNEGDHGGAESLSHGFAVPASPIPFVPSGHFPLIRGIGLSQGGLFEQHISPPCERGDTAEGGGGIPSPRPKGLLHKPQQKDQSYLAKRLYNSGLLL